MFEDQLAGIPSEPPRPTSLLPGLRVRSVIPLSALWVPLLFLGFFATVPLIFALEDRQTRLALGRSQTVAGTVGEVAGRDEHLGWRTG